MLLGAGDRHKRENLGSIMSLMQDKEEENTSDGLFSPLVVIRHKKVALQGKDKGGGERGGTLKWKVPYLSRSWPSGGSGGS